MRYFGFYQFSLPTLMVNDLDLIQRITIKDFQSFTDHQEMIPNEADEFWARNIFAVKGSKWHDLRVTLSPAFTSSKMKAMFHFMTESAKQFTDYYWEETKSKAVTIELKDSFSRYTNDVIATSAYGVKCNSLKEKDNEFFTLGREAFTFRGWKSFKFFGYAISPTLMKLFNIKLFDDRVKSFFQTVVKDTIRFRKENKIVRPDMIHLLMEAQKGKLVFETDSKVIDKGFAVVEEFSTYEEAQGKSLKYSISDEDIAAQALVFFFGGYDTSSLLMCHLAYELMINTDEQQKLLEEVDVTLADCNGAITYEALLGMSYLDMAITETLRKWSPAFFLQRLCTKPFIIKAKLPGEKDLQLDIGATVWIPVHGIHMDPKYYPDPKKFNPERFNEENKRHIRPGTYLPFGTGPRNCIGSRFALLEAKVIMVELLSKFELVPVRESVIPLKLSKQSINILPEGGFWVGLKRRQH